MFTNQGTVIHFNNPKVQASLAANTFTITGHAESKQLTEMLPGILNQLGADSLTSLRRLAETLPKPGKEHCVIVLHCSACIIVIITVWLKCTHWVFSPHPVAGDKAPMLTVEEEEDDDVPGMYNHESPLSYF